MKEDGRIHASFHQVGAKARFSCSGPNLQNVEVKSGIRAAFAPKDGHVLIQADYAAIELRIAAVIAQDNAFLTCFARNGDPHQESAERWGIPEQRSIAKNCNFEFIYGGGAKKFSKMSGIPLKKAESLKELFFKDHPSFRQYFKDTLAELRRFEYVRTLIGRKRYFRGYRDRAYKCFECSTEYGEAFYSMQDVALNGRTCPECDHYLSETWEGAAINYKIQGTAADRIRN